MKLIVCRHGQTEYNAENRIQGQVQDSPLTEEGKATARAAGKALKEVKFDKVYVSPLGRTLATAELILEGRGIEYEKEPLIMEITQGPAEGLLRSEAKEKLKDFHAERAKGIKEYYNTCYPEGESYACLEKRAREFLEKVKAENKADSVLLVVCHQAIGRVLVSIAIGRAWENIPCTDFPNEVYYEIDMDSKELVWHNVKSSEKGEGMLEREFKLG